MTANITQSHGFTTKEGWKTFFDDYNESVQTLNQMGYDLIRTELPLESWIESYRNYSDENRRTYIRIEAMIEIHIRYFVTAPYHWTKETADSLLAYLHENIEGVEDMECAYMAAHSLSEFYMERDDLAALAACCAVKAVCLTFLDPIHMNEELWQICSQGIRYYEETFYELSAEEQRLGLTLYDVAFYLIFNRLGREDSNDSMALDSSLQCFYAGREAERRVLANNPGITVDCNVPSLDRCFSFGALLLSPGQCSRPQGELILRAARQAERKICARESRACPAAVLSSKIVRLMAQRLTGEQTDARLYALIHEFLILMEPVLTCSEEAIAHEMILAVEDVYLASKNLWCNREEEPLFQRVIRFYSDFFIKLSYSSLHNYISSTHIYRYACNSLKYSEEADILHFLLRMAGFRQMQTVTHSIMVSKLSVTIVNAMVEKKPELLVGQLSAKTAEEVREKKDEMLEFIRNGALVHDIGKIACSSIINAQYRRLSPIGYQIIQFHPVSGGELLENLPRLSIYRDIALGHHKSYDGKTGYPKEFDHTKSPMRIFIEVVALCDSMDAGTDHMGRSYAAAKTFDQILREMNYGKNTRYNGDLLDLIQENPELQQELRTLVSQGRYQTYYEVHRLIRSQAGYGRQSG